MQEKASLDDEVHLLVQQKATLELDVGEADGKLDNQKSLSEKAREELEELQGLIDAKQRELELAKDAFDKAQRTELDITERYDSHPSCLADIAYDYCMRAVLSLDLEILTCLVG